MERERWLSACCHKRMRKASMASDNVCTQCKPNSRAFYLKAVVLHQVINGGVKHIHDKSAQRTKESDEKKKRKREEEEEEDDVHPNTDRDDFDSRKRMHTFCHRGSS